MLGLLKCRTSRTIKMPRQRYRHRWICNLPGRPAVAPPPPPTASREASRNFLTSKRAQRPRGELGFNYWAVSSEYHISLHHTEGKGGKKVMRSVCEARYVRREAESLLFPDVWLCCDKGPIIWSLCLANMLASVFGSSRIQNLGLIRHFGRFLKNSFHSLCWAFVTFWVLLKP